MQLQRPSLKAVRRRGLAALAVLSMLFGMLVSVGAQQASAAPGCNPYPDVDNANPHCENISWLSGVGITKPADGLYHPLNSVNRGSMAAFLFRMVKPGDSQPACRDKPFPDVPTTSTFCGYIQWAKDNGIAYGYSNGSYGPQNPVTRGAMAAYPFRIANPGHGAAPCSTKPFNDVGIGDTFCGVITWMVDNKITYGVGDGTDYGTTLPVTRQAMASFIHRIADPDRTLSIGETIGQYIDGELAADVTVERVRRVNGPLGRYDSAPTHSYIIVDVKIQAYSGVKKTLFGTYDVNPFHWTIEDAQGYRYDHAFVIGVDHQLHAESLSPGDMIRGTVVFDAPTHGTIVVAVSGTDSKVKWKY